MLWGRNFLIGFTLLMGFSPAWADDAEGTWKTIEGATIHVADVHRSNATYSFDIDFDRANGTHAHAQGLWVERNRSFTYIFDGKNRTVFTATFDPKDHDKINVEAPGIKGLWTRI